MFSHRQQLASHLLGLLGGVFAHTHLIQRKLHRRIAPTELGAKKCAPRAAQRRMLVAARDIARYTGSVARHAQYRLQCHELQRLAAEGPRAEVEIRCSAQASLPVLEAGLARTLNLPAGTDLKLSAPGDAPKLSVTLAALQGGLDKRLPSLVQAANAAALNASGFAPTDAREAAILATRSP